MKDLYRAFEYRGNKVQIYRWSRKCKKATYHYSNIIIDGREIVSSLSDDYDPEIEAKERIDRRIARPIRAR